MNTATIPEAT